MGEPRADEALDAPQTTDGIATPTPPWGPPRGLPWQSSIIQCSMDALGYI